MTKLSVYTVKGTKIKEGINLPEKYIEQKNIFLLAQAIRVYENRLHAKNARTKRRGEVKASTRKIYAQKGTGQARHGALSAPIFVGGGKAHGPDGKSRSLQLSKKMSQKALAVSLSLKVKDDLLLVVDGLESLKKTKEAADLLKKLLKTINKNKCENVCIAVSDANKKVSMYLINIKGLKVERFSDLNAYKVFQADVLIVDKQAFSEKQNKNIDEKKKVQKK
ncbi:50S ribosomal protein L4 [Candidatus Woesebacteria bacterium]|nr:50S ribosomal protein L4 [Candidatus Woesebacteria bacterium]